MKKLSITLRIISLAILMSLILSSFTMIAQAAGEYDISAQDSIQFAAALNASTDELIYALNEKSYHIFDYENEEFKSLFKSRKNSFQDVISITGSSRSEFSSEFAQNRSTSTSMGVSAPVPVGDVSANIGAQFATDIAKNLASINEEYYEYFEFYNRTRIVTAYWEDYDLTNFFKASFLREYNSIENATEAKAFLKKYGTHLFHTYHMGGSLVITKYVVSEENIATTYEGQSKSLSLEANVADAMSAAASGSDSSVSANNVNTATTKSQNDMKAYGGGSMNAMTVDDLFTYNQEFASGQGSGFVYKHWMETLENGVNEVVIDAKEPIAIWDLMGTKYGNATTNALLKDAFDMMCFENYAALCQENDINSDIIGNISYKVSNIDVSFTVSDEKIFLPAGTTVTLDFGENITNNNRESTTSFKIIGDASIATLSGKNKINISSSANGKTFKINVLMGDNVIQQLSVEVKNGSYAFAGGYGTKDQPYIISNADHWKALSDVCNEHYNYILANDIDLGGEFFEPIGMRSGEAFNGNLDGNSKTISNFTVVPKSSTTCENMGIFAVNKGTIKNLVVDNVKCLTNLLQTNDSINAGILVGENNGTIDNILIRNSAIRATADLQQPKNTSPKLNVGAICGYSSPFAVMKNLGTVSCNVYGISFSKKGTINVGGIAGNISGVNLTNCYAYNSNVNVKSEDDENVSGCSVGAALGYAADYVVKNDETSSTIGAIVSNCVTDNITLNQSSNNYGYIAGKADSASQFKQCFYHGTSEKSVSGKSKSGCELVTKALTLKNTFANDPNWIAKDEMIILADHLEMID